MQIKKYISLLAIVLTLHSCTKSEYDLPKPTPEGPITVGFRVGKSDTRTDLPDAGYEMDAPLGAETTRTQINDDGISTSWCKDDKIALWANNAEGTSVLSATPFEIYYRDSHSSSNSQATYNNYAMFTTTLSSAMDEGEYTYYATYPTPKSVNGTSASFTIPAVQDGLMGGGSAIMVAEPAKYAQLQKVLDIPGDQEINDDHLSLRMKHKTHALRFYAPSTNWGFSSGEKIERIVFTMPQGIAGDLTLDYTDLDAVRTTANTSNTISLNLTKPIGASASAATLDHACAAIIPTINFNDGDEIHIKAYTEKQYAEHTISLSGRNAMQAGHITPVAIDCSSPINLPKISFRIKSNNLGEQPYKITLTSAETSTQWKDGDDHIYEYYTGSETSTIPTESGFDLYSNEELLSTISGKIVTVTYESKSAIVTETITMPTITANGTNNISLNVPYLFSEDFRTLSTYDGDYTAGPYTSVDKATTAARDLSQYGLSAGWSGARTGCDAANTAILVSGRVDNVIAGATRAYGRLDSPTLSTIKPNCSIKVNVSFSYSGAEEENIDYYYPVGKIGYTIDDGLLNGYATQFNNNQAFSGIEGAVDIPSIPTNGSATNAQNGEKSMNYTINNCTSKHRLSWHVMQYGFKSWKINNDYGILYIDNIKVQIVE